MKYALVAMLLIAGCASPAEDYIRADAAAWAQYDPFIDSWVDKSDFSADKKDALHQLNVGRRARINHAIAAIKT